MIRTCSRGVVQQAYFIRNMQRCISFSRVLNTSTIKPGETTEPLTFQGNTNIHGSDEERMGTVFGARLKGGARESSSRREAREPRRIAGVLVPDKPSEPHNCCMSGCVNCVWEQYNDDFREWRQLRKEAAGKLNKSDEIWPADFNPPLKELEMKNVPRELKKEKLKMTNRKRISSSAYFPPNPNKKQGAVNARKVVPELNQPASIIDEDDAWKDVPVSFKVFAETERKMKQRKLEKQRKRREQEAAAAAAAASESGSRGSNLSKNATV